MIRQAEWRVAGALSLLLFWAPLPFASVTPWPAAALEVAAFLIFTLALASPESARALRLLAWPAGALAAVSLLGLLQSLSVPRALAARLSPAHLALADRAGEVLAGRGQPDLTLSLSPSASRGAALLFAAAAAGLLAAGVAGRERRCRRALALALFSAALFQVLYGARRWFERSREIWGREVPGTADRLRGTFVNPNHLAFFLGLALPLVFAWAWWSARKARAELRLERRVLLIAPPALLWLTLFAGLAFTGSRAGMLAAVAAVALQGLLLAARERNWRLLAIGLGVALSGVGVVAFLGRQEGFGRFLALSGGVGLTARLETWRASLGLVRRFPLLGTGLGTFREAFPLVQPAGLAGTWRHAHCDPLELLATAGPLAVAVAVAGAAGLARRLARVFRSGHRSEDRAAGLAALGMLAAVLLHELADFGLTLPANALAAAVLLGAAASAKCHGDGGAGGRREQADAAGQDRAARDHGDFEEMDPGSYRRGQREGLARGREEAAEEGAVEADVDDRRAGRDLVDRDVEA
ncbi:MAG TPA: O-antigen ligase family protein [Thermoanaerobaculia bacterium]|nr:O-antigen ligase family protein [Thermoanaerobaculia bacterium]